MGRKRLALDETVFDTITEESLYWAGFLLADGSIAYKPGLEPRISLELSDKDALHLEKFKQFLKSGHALTVSTSRRAAFFSVRSLALVRALARMGVFPRYAAGSDLPYKENRHFWRGYLDGNGCIGVYGGYPRLHVSGHHKILEAFLGYVRTIVPKCRSEIRNTKSGWVLMITSSNAREVLRQIYDDSSIKLERKTETLQQIFAYN